MTSLVIYLYALLTSQDTILCDLWTRVITREALIAACGSEQLSGYRVDAYALDMTLLCSRDSVELLNILASCNLPAPLDLYLLRIVRHTERNLLCIVESANQSAPSADEIAAQCPDAIGKIYVIESAGVKQADPPAWTCPARVLANGDGLYEQAEGPAALATAEPLTWLAGKLIWSGMVRPACNGSGLNPRTLAANDCGMAQAQAMVTLWQNQFDAQIYTSATAYNIPAKLLKKILITESQLWPFYSADHSRAGETTVMQITDNGFDTLLRFDPALDVDYLGRDDINQLWARAVLRDQLVCMNCDVEQAIENIKQNMDIYARLIAAYHCRAVTINPALAGHDAWRQAVVDYNGGAEYLARIEQ